MIKKMRQGEIKKLKSVERAYIAGLVDADGCIGISRVKSLSSSYEYDFVLRVIVTNSNTDVLDWLKEVIGAGCSNRVNKSYKPNWSVVHRYVITGEKARSLILQIKPYLIIKKHRADEALEIPKRKRGEGGQNGRTKSTYSKQFEVYERMLDLNNRLGIKNSQCTI